MKNIFLLIFISNIAFTQSIHPKFIDTSSHPRRITDFIIKDLKLYQLDTSCYSGYVIVKFFIDEKGGVEISSTENNLPKKVIRRIEERIYAMNKKWTPAMLNSKAVKSKPFIFLLDIVNKDCDNINIDVKSEYRDEGLRDFINLISNYINLPLLDEGYIELKDFYLLGILFTGSIK